MNFCWKHFCQAINSYRITAKQGNKPIYPPTTRRRRFPTRYHPYLERHLPPRRSSHMWRSCAPPLYTIGCQGKGESVSATKHQKRSLLRMGHCTGAYLRVSDVARTLPREVGVSLQPGWWRRAGRRSAAPPTPHRCEDLSERRMRNIIRYTHSIKSTGAKSALLKM